MTGALELAAGRARLRLVPGLGGRVTALRLVPRGAADAREVLVPFPEDARFEDLLHWPKGGLYPLLPYGNRIRGARLIFLGREHGLPAHPDAAPHTLHGHAHRAAWRTTRTTDDAAEWAFEHPGGGEWPWRFLARLSARLSPSALTLEIGLRNDDAGPMPGGLGLHPYFVHDPRDAVGFRAATDWPPTPDSLADPPRPAPADHDPPRALPPGDVTLYRGGWDGGFDVRRVGGDVLRLRADPAFDHLVVHRPAGAGYLCVEPTTHAPDGFNAAEAGVAGAGRRTLDPGATLSASVVISLDR